MEKYWNVWPEREDWHIGDDIDDCIKQARDSYPNIEFIYVGDLERAKLSVDSVELIEELQSIAYNEYDEDMAGWLDDVSDMQIQELADCTNEALQKWLDKNNLQPTFGNIVNIEKVEV